MRHSAASRKVLKFEIGGWFSSLLQAGRTHKRRTIHERISIIEALAQASNEQTRQLFQAQLRGRIREALLEMMEEEAEGLCGPRYRPDRSRGYRRGGSDEGTIYLGGKRQQRRRESPACAQKRATGANVIDADAKGHRVGIELHGFLRAWSELL